MIFDKKFIARSRLRFLLGSGMAGIFLSVLNILTFARVWQSTFDFYNIPLIIVYIGIPAFYMIACWGIGLWYEQTGLWGEESSHINQKLNPEFLKVCKDIDLIKNKLGIKDEDEVK